jgi:hypothetical protein
LGLTSPISIHSEKLGQHFNREITKIVTAIDELGVNNKPEVRVSPPIFFLFHYFSFQFLLLLGEFGHNPYFQGQLKNRYEQDMRIIHVGEMK